MRQVSIDNLYKNLAKEIKQVPFEVTRHGKAVAEMCPPGTIESLGKEQELAEKLIESLEKKAKDESEPKETLEIEPKDKAAKIESIKAKLETLSGNAQPNTTFKQMLKGKK